MEASSMDQAPSLVPTTKWVASPSNSPPPSQHNTLYLHLPYLFIPGFTSVHHAVVVSSSPDSG